MPFWLGCACNIWRGDSGIGKRYWPRIRTETSSAGCAISLRFQNGTTVSSRPSRAIWPTCRQPSGSGKTPASGCWPTSAARRNISKRSRWSRKRRRCIWPNSPTKKSPTNALSRNWSARRRASTVCCASWRLDAGRRPPSPRPAPSRRAE